MMPQNSGHNVTGGGGDASADRRASHLHPNDDASLCEVGLYHCLSLVGGGRKGQLRRPYH